MESNTAEKLLDRSAIENILKNQTRVGHLIGMLAEGIQDACLVLDDEGLEKHQKLHDRLMETYLAMKVSGDLLYDQAVRTARSFDLKDPEDSMWGN